jgi:hypothetical protein
MTKGNGSSDLGQGNIVAIQDQRHHNHQQHRRQKGKPKKPPPTSGERETAGHHGVGIRNLSTPYFLSMVMQ